MLKEELERAPTFKIVPSALNRIICDDSQDALGVIQPGLVKLIYLDPPFFSNRNFHSKAIDGRIYSFKDTWDNSMEGYISFMTNILSKCHNILADSGSLYLHCDWHASHYLKIVLDRIFGYNRFRNEIIWKRHNSHNDTKQGAKKLGPIHDVIFFYTKSDKYTWIPPYQKYSEEYVDKFYRHVEPETKRRFAYGDLSGPGGKSKGNPYYRFLGVYRYWRYSKANMQKLYAEGKIVQSAKGRVPKLKRYLDEMKGVVLQDIWNDIPPIRTNKSTRFPTEKPLKLLERIIEMSTTNKDIVLDPFCGSGTSLVAASNLGRKFIGIDINNNACELARKRLRMKNIQTSVEYNKFDQSEGSAKIY